MKQYYIKVDDNKVNQLKEEYRYFEHHLISKGAGWYIVKRDLTDKQREVLKQEAERKKAKKMRQNEDYDG